MNNFPRIRIAGVDRGMELARLALEGTPDLHGARVVAHSQQEFTSSDLRSYLKAKVPDWMVPSAILLIEQMPMTTNGKVDRKALPAPTASAVPEQHFVAPHTFVQELLAGKNQLAQAPTPQGV